MRSLKHIESNHPSSTSALAIWHQSRLVTSQSGVSRSLGVAVALASTAAQTDQRRRRIVNHRQESVIKAWLPFDLCAIEETDSNGPVPEKENPNAG